MPAKHETHSFWLFLHDISGVLSPNNIRYMFPKLCREIGIDGFDDDGCEGWIHPNEPCQTVFFRSNIFQEVREFKNNRDFNADATYKVADKKVLNNKDVLNILNKYGFTFENIGKIVNVASNYQDVIDFIFKEHKDSIDLQSNSNYLFMEALVYTFLLIGTLMVLFFAVFFRDTPKIIK